MKPTLLRVFGVLALAAALAAPALTGSAAALNPSDGSRTSGAPDAAPRTDLTLQALPNDTSYTKQWAPGKVNLPQAWDITTGSANVTIAVVDSGVDLTHPDLQSKLVPGRNIVTGTADAQDDLGHGTHVAGIIAAVTNNGTGVAGACWGCKIMPVKVFKVTRDAGGNITCVTASDADVAAGIRWAVDSGAKIINLSAGGPDPKGPNATLQEAITYAYGKGALIVAAAGNEAAENPETDACNRPTGNKLEPNPVVYPAAMSNVLAVGSTSNKDTRSSFSGFKPYVRLTAPGGDNPAGSETPEQAMVLSTALRSSGKDYTTEAGTSQAAPLVSGIAGLMWSVNPSLTNAQIEDILQKTAVDLGTPGRDDQYGYGRVDAFAAVKAAQAAGGGPAPALSGPADNAALSGLGTSLTWQNPPGTVQVQVQVFPAKNDGPAINLILGDPALVSAAKFDVTAPAFGQGPYIMLPGMSYTWRVRTTKMATPMSESSPGWDQWSPFRTFRTPAPTAATLSVVAPADGATVSGAGALSLQWADSNRANFYYEVQASGDTRFDPDPATATSFVFWNLVHGGITTPPDSWAMPASALTPGTTFYWRVRPRVQGDGAEVAWGPVWSFKTP